MSTHRIVFLSLSPRALCDFCVGGALDSSQANICGACYKSKLEYLEDYTPPTTSIKKEATSSGSVSLPILFQAFSPYHLGHLKKIRFWIEKNASMVDNLDAFDIVATHPPGFRASLFLSESSRGILNMLLPLFGVSDKVKADMMKNGTEVAFAMASVEYFLGSRLEDEIKTILFEHSFNAPDLNTLMNLFKNPIKKESVPAQRLLSSASEIATPGLGFPAPLPSALPPIWATSRVLEPATTPAFQPPGSLAVPNFLAGKLLYGRARFSMEAKKKAQGEEIVKIEEKKKEKKRPLKKEESDTESEFEPSSSSEDESSDEEFLLKPEDPPKKISPKKKKNSKKKSISVKKESVKKEHNVPQYALKGSTITKGSYAGRTQIERSKYFGGAIEGFHIAGIPMGIILPHPSMVCTPDKTYFARLSRPDHVVKHREGAVVPRKSGYTPRTSVSKHEPALMRVPGPEDPFVPVKTPAALKGKVNFLSNFSKPPSVSL